MKTMFRLGEFVLHSGKKSKWKIDCDILTDADYEALAWIVTEEMGIKFSWVTPILRGGYLFAEKLQCYQTKNLHKVDGDPILIVDDVLTTGKSFVEARDKLLKCVLNKEKAQKDIIGIVIFARGKCPDWVHTIFQLSDLKTK